jgi:hypothetical protein
LQGDGLWLLIAQTDSEPGPVGGDREVSIPEPSHQIEGLLGRLLLRASQRVAFDVLLDRRAHLRCCAEVPVGRYEPVQRLVRPLEVVPLDEEPEAPLAIGEVGEDGAAQEFIPQRLPETLDLPQGLRVLGAALDVPDPVLAQPLLEEGLSTPGRVLPPLIGQHFLRRPEGCNSTLQRLEHERALLMMRQHEAHQESRVVVHERRQVEPLVASEQKCEDVRLPQLVGRRALEAARRPLPPVDRAGHRRCHQPRIGENLSHLGGGDTQRLESLHHVSDPPRAVLWVLLLERQHRRHHRV